VYSPSAYSSWAASVTAYYPGSAYVDLVGEDVYSAVGGLPDYTQLLTLGKPIVLTECGPNSASYGKYDQILMIQNIVGKACYFLQWHSWSGAAVAIKDNLKASEMMNSDHVISRDEIDLVNTSTGEIIKRPTFGKSDYFRVYPNPSKGVIKLESEINLEVVSKINLYHTNGTFIKELSLNRQNNQMDISELAKGMYFLKILTNNGASIDRIIKL
jgi:hypothetical protein